LKKSKICAAEILWLQTEERTKGEEKYNIPSRTSERESIRSQRDTEVKSQKVLRCSQRLKNQIETRWDTMQPLYASCFILTATCYIGGNPKMIAGMKVFRQMQNFWRAYLT